MPKRRGYTHWNVNAIGGGHEADGGEGISKQILGIKKLQMALLNSIHLVFWILVYSPSIYRLHSDRKSARIEFAPLTFECLALSIYELCSSRNIINERARISHGNGVGGFSGRVRAFSCCFESEVYQVGSLLSWNFLPAALVSCRVSNVHISINCIRKRHRVLRPAALSHSISSSEVIIEFKSNLKQAPFTLEWMHKNLPDVLGRGRWAQESVQKAQPDFSLSRKRKQARDFSCNEIFECYAEKEFEISDIENFPAHLYLLQISLCFECAYTNDCKWTESVSLSRHFARADSFNLNGYVCCDRGDSDSTWDENWIWKLWNIGVD